MTKSIKSKVEINKLIAEKAAGKNDCQGVTFGDIYWHELDVVGCNWDIKTMSGDGWEPCAAVMSGYIQELQKTYNIPDER